jgi:acetoin utilization deacetylase AcuC-like enzyme
MTHNSPNPLLPVYFTGDMVAPRQRHSPSADKPAKVVASWALLGLPIEILEPEPVTARQLCLAHDRGHVENILTSRARNGFDNRSPQVAASLPYTSGAMLAAARHALATGAAAVAPASGFHHAGHAFTGGFCTFNGLMVTACALHEEGLVRRVGILDCDMHYGDGTEDIIKTLGVGSWVRHFTAGGAYRSPSQAADFLARLPQEVEAMRGCDIVLYQAGADPHVNDPLGGFLSTDELRARDAIVFRGLAELGVPVAWNLAGGYQVEPDGSIPEVLEIHANTAIECLEAFGYGMEPKSKVAAI